MWRCPGHGWLPEKWMQRIHSQLHPGWTFVSPPRRWRFIRQIALHIWLCAADCCWRTKWWSAVGTQEFRCVQAASNLRVFQWSQVERGLSRIREFHEVLWLLMLVGGLVAIFYFPINVGNVIIPIVIFFRGVALAHQPEWLWVKILVHQNRWDPRMLKAPMEKS